MSQCTCSYLANIKKGICSWVVLYKVHFSIKKKKTHKNKKAQVVFLANCSIKFEMGFWGEGGIKIIQ